MSLLVVAVVFFGPSAMRDLLVLGAMCACAGLVFLWVIAMRCIVHHVGHLEKLPEEPATEAESDGTE